MCLFVLFFFISAFSKREMKRTHLIKRSFTHQLFFFSTYIKIKILSWMSLLFDNHSKISHKSHLFVYRFWFLFCFGFFKVVFQFYKRFYVPTLSPCIFRKFINRTLKPRFIHFECRFLNQSQKQINFLEHFSWTNSIRVVCHFCSYVLKHHSKLIDQMQFYVINSSEHLSNAVAEGKRKPHKKKEHYHHQTHSHFISFMYLKNQFDHDNFDETNHLSTFIFVFKRKKHNLHFRVYGTLLFSCFSF